MSEFWRHPQVPTYTSGTTAFCPSCRGGCNGSCRWWWQPQPPVQHRGSAEIPAKGCICPPGAEKSCQRGDCGRKTPSISIGGAVLENREADLADANTKKDTP